MLSDAQIERYSRQIILPQIGGRGQAALLSSTVGVCGTGGMAATAALYLAAAGVGTLGVAPALVETLDGVNPDCRVLPRAWDDTPSATAAAAGAAAVLCAGVAPDVMRRMNAVCLAVRVPLLCGASTGASAWMCVTAGFGPTAPCFGCLAASLEDSGDAEALPLGAVAAALIGTLLATAAIKLVLGIGAGDVGRLLVYDAAGTVVSQVARAKDPACSACRGRA